MIVQKESFYLSKNINSKNKGIICEESKNLGLGSLSSKKSTTALVFSHILKVESKY